MDGAGLVDVSTHQRFPYKPLGPGEVRLLTVHPELTPNDGLVQCSLEQLSFQDSNPDYVSKGNDSARYTWGDYIALSYCWGWDSSNPSKRISLNGHLVRVTENLEAALQSIRTTRETRSWLIRFWIDAICINQTDSSEVKCEVLRMRDIYSQAMAVFVHLGPEMDDSGLGIEFLSDTATKLAQGMNCYKSLLDLRFNYTDEDRKAYRAVIKLLSRPYWHRVWVLQELAVSNGNITVGCGERKIGFKDILTAAKFFCINLECLVIITGDGLGPEFTRLMSTLWMAMWTDQARDQRQLSGPSQNPTYLDLRLPLLTLAQNAQATMPHDKVYGLLGLMPGAVREKMGPYIDYNLPVNTMFAAFSRAMIEVTGDLDIIFAKNFEQTMSPSWATDWRLSFDRAGLPHDWDLYCYDQFDGAYTSLPQVIDASRNARADGGRKAAVQFLNSSHGERLLLKCSGILIGTVDGVSSYVPPNGAVGRCPDPVNVQPVCQASPYGNEEATSRALIHTLYANPAWGDTEETSLFHIPWLASVPLFNPDGTLFVDASMQDRVNQMGERGWDAAFGNNFYAFEWFRRRLAHFRIGGKGFMDYFAAEATQCVFPSNRIKLDMATALGAAIGRRLITLSPAGHFGLAPRTARAGDCIYVLLGCSLPMVLRPVEGAVDGQFEVVGECYVEGYMNGEVVKDGGALVRDVVLC